MSESENNLVTSYCVGLASAFRRLSQDLSIPLIDQELYTDLFVRPLEEQQSSNDGPSAASSVSTLNTSASDMQAEALVALGGTELLVTALRSHEQQTLLVLQAIALRESVVTRMWSCCDAFKETSPAAAEEARFTFLRLLQEHQLVTLLTVEAIFEWREMLSRPYPFVLRNGENYLLSILSDCAALDAHPLLRSLANVRLRQDPLCAKVDLKRLQHRLETMRRSRLITTGALWNVGLQPLQPLQPLAARSRSRSTDVGRRAPSAGRSSTSGDRSSGAGNTAYGRRGKGAPAGRASLPIPRSPPPTAEAQKASRLSHFHGSKPDDFVSEVARLSNALKRNQEGGPYDKFTPPASPGTSVSSHLPSTSTSKRFPVPQPPVQGDGAEARRRQHRLLTAARVIETEATLHRKVVTELHDLAHAKARFVPLLDIPQLFTSAGGASAHGSGLQAAKNGFPLDSWPLDRAQWPAVVAAEGRVDRLGCMSAAREALQACNLLPAWQRRMGRRASDISGHLFNHSKTSVASTSSTAAEGPLTPLHPAHSGSARAFAHAKNNNNNNNNSSKHSSKNNSARVNATANNTTTTATTAVGHSSRYSPSSKRTSNASASGFVADTRRPVMAKSEVYSASSASFSTSPSSSAASLPRDAQETSHEEATDEDTQHEAARQQVEPAAHDETAEAEYSDEFSSDFESESDGDGEGNEDAEEAEASPESTPAKEEMKAHSSHADESSASDDENQRKAMTPSSSSEEVSHELSLDELREQLLAEHRLNSRSQSYSL